MFVLLKEKRLNDSRKLLKKLTTKVKEKTQQVEELKRDVEAEKNGNTAKAKKDPREKKTKGKRDFLQGAPSAADPNYVISVCIES